MVLTYKKTIQKCRSFIKFNYWNLKFGNCGIISASSGFVCNRVLQSFIVRFRNTFKPFKSITKFWFYLSSFYIVTKKALNVRMGKGKGSRKGTLALIKSGNSLVELNYCRLGLLLKLYKYISVRCSFKTNYVFCKTFSTARFNLHLNNFNVKFKPYKKIKNKKYISSRLNEVFSIYKKSSFVILLKEFDILRGDYLRLKVSSQINDYFFSDRFLFIHKYFKKKIKYSFFFEILNDMKFDMLYKNTNNLKRLSPLSKNSTRSVKKLLINPNSEVI